MQFLEPFARLGAVVLGATYAAGFVIVNLHHAELGIPDLSLLRARVVGAGFLFMMMTILPVAGTARIYGLFGLGAEHGVSFRTRPEDERVGNIIYSLVLYQLCFAFAFLSRMFFEDSSRDDWTSWAFIVPAALVLTLGSYISYGHPWKCAGLVAVAMVALGWSAWVGWGRVFFARTVWFYQCALVTVWLRSYVGKAERFKVMRLELLLPLPFVLLSFFSVAIYGNAKPHFGGGAPIQVLVHLSQDVSRVFGTETLPAWLIEQTDDAIYILRTREDRKAILLPRSQIRVLEFQYAPTKPAAKQQ